MKRKLIVSGLLCAVLLSACSSVPKLKEPSGPWVDANPPIVNKGSGK